MYIVVARVDKLAPLVGFIPVTVITDNMLASGMGMSLGMRLLCGWKVCEFQAHNTPHIMGMPKDDAYTIILGAIAVVACLYHKLMIVS